MLDNEKQPSRERRRDVPYLVLLGVLLYTITPVTFNAGLKLTQASRAPALGDDAAVERLLARLSKGEHLTPRQISGVLLTFTGVGGSQSWSGHEAAERATEVPILYKSPALYALGDSSSA